MGKVYWKIDGSTNTFESLNETLEGFGLLKIDQRPLGTEFGFNRVSVWKTKGGLLFSTIWYKNLCHIRFGEFENDIAEITFDAIQGSYLPYSEHNTVDFVYRGNAVSKLAILKEGEQK